MRFVWELHHHRGNFAKLQGPEHFLAAGAGRSARVTFTKDKHHRRLHVLDIGDGGARFEIVRIIERRRFKPVGLKESEIGRVPPMCPARDVTLRRSRRKSLGVRNDPVC